MSVRTRCRFLRLNSHFYIIHDGNATPVPYAPTPELPLGFVYPPHVMAPDPELPEPPRWYKGSRMQWQYDRSALAIAYAAEKVAFDCNVDLHNATPRATFYVLGSVRDQDASTVCGCWHCGGKSPEAVALRAAEQRTRGAEQAAYKRRAS